MTETFRQSEKPITWRYCQKPNLPQLTWRIGSTQWAGGHLRQELAIDDAPPQIGFSPHQILLHHHPKSQNSGLETQNRLKATSHQKLVTDGTSDKMVPTHTVRLTTNLPRAEPNANNSLLSTRSRGGGEGGGNPRVSSFAQNSNRIRLELYASLLVYITQALIKLLYGFIGPKLGWKKD